MGNDNTEEKEYIYIPDEEGNEEKFEVIYQFEAEDKQYILVIPTENVDEEDEEEVFAFRYVEDEEGLQLEMIEDEEEWDMIEEVFNTLNHEFNK